MTTNTRKAATIAAVAATLAVAMLAYSTMILPASAQAATNSTSTSTPGSNTNAPQGRCAGILRAMQAQGGPVWAGQGQTRQEANIAVGQTITVSSTQGTYRVVGNANQTGAASGTITFTVTGKLATGFTLSVTQGTIVVNGTTYTVSSGSAQMGRYATTLVGQGATTPSAQFLVRATAHGSFAGTTATMSLDLNTGATEYLVFLAGTVQG